MTRPALQRKCEDCGADVVGLYRTCEACCSPNALRMRQRKRMVIRDHGPRSAVSINRGITAQMQQRAAERLELCEHSQAIEAAVQRLEAAAARYKRHVSGLEKYLADSASGVVSIHSAQLKSRSENSKTGAA